MKAPAGLRPCLAVTGSVGAFASLVEHGGFVPAVMAAVLVASLGSSAVRIREALFLSACLAAALSLLFVLLLGQPFRLFVAP